jgi:phenylpropionate dioxygenase-like ring-hydroxylating dioxygenase large terminal subunit
VRIEDCWHPVALSHSIEAGSSAGTRLLDRELVVWRDNSGVAHVWEDRCPHRGMKLSFGFVRGDHIACLYHGWQYNSGGHCQYIPAHPALDVPKTIKVPVYPVHERNGMIWTTLSQNPTATPEHDEAVVPLRSLYLGCGFDAAVAALGSSRLAPFASEASAETMVSRVNDTLFAVSCAHDKLLAGVQPISKTRTALHLSLCGPAERYLGAGQAHFNDWALQLRHAIERVRAAHAAPDQDMA